MNMKRILVLVMALTALRAVFPQDAVFPEFSMGMSKEDAAALYPNLRFEKDDAWVSLGNAVLTRCYIDTVEGLYRVESAMKEDDEEFINALEDTFTRRHGSPFLVEPGPIWSVDYGNTFDDDDTWVLTLYRRNGFLTVGKEYKNAPAINEGWDFRPWEHYYTIMGQGPAGGVVFYDKGHSLDGWRYLEAAPPETERKAPWGWDRYGPFTDDEIGQIPGGLGDGLQSTEIIVKKLTEAGIRGCAAQLCASLEHGGYDDWYLPTLRECYLMLEELREYAPAKISKNDYWTSSLALRDIFNMLFARYISWDGTWFGNGITADKGEERSVRAVRKF